LKTESTLLSKSRLLNSAWIAYLSSTYDLMANQLKIKGLSNSQLVLLASRASVVVAIILIVIKVYALVMTNSVGLLASLVDSSLDLLVSLINLFAVHYALKPADKCHRFGHGKAESIAGLAQAAFISISALFLIGYAILHLLDPQPLKQINWGIGIVTLSIVLTGLLVIFQTIVIKKTNSIAIKADRLHYQSDLWTNLSVLFALILTLTGIQYADTVIGLLLGVYILECAIKLGYEAIQVLLDRSLPEQVTEEIISITAKYPEIVEIHDIRTRQSGKTAFIQFHLVFNGDMSLTEAHKLAESVEQAILDLYNEADILIHLDPHTHVIQPLKQIA